MDVATVFVVVGIVAFGSTVMSGFIVGTFITKAFMNWFDKELEIHTQSLLKEKERIEQELKQVLNQAATKIHGQSESQVSFTAESEETDKPDLN